MAPKALALTRICADDETILGASHGATAALPNRDWTAVIARRAGLFFLGEFGRRCGNSDTDSAALLVFDDALGTGTDTDLSRRAK